MSNVLKTSKRVAKLKASSFFGVLGILKIKDHVENPSQTKLQDGAIRLVAGGGLFALPIVFEAMQGSIGDGAGPDAIDINSVGNSFNLN